MKIHFCSIRRPHGYMSNFYPSPVELDGKVWPTTEHYYQAQKFPGDPTTQEKIRNAPGPMAAARIGRTAPMSDMRGWMAGGRDLAMMVALSAKFTQHHDLREKLIATGDAVLVERTDRDAYWGDGPDGEGKNTLGKMLMVVRDDLRELGSCDELAAVLEL